MAVKGYFEKIRMVEESLPGEQVVVVSLATADGGKEGKLLELTRALAAKMIVDGKARLATEDEARYHRETLVAENREAAARMAEPKTAFLAEIATAHQEAKRARKRSI